MADHFTPASLKFLRGIARHNDREWFAANKSTFESEVKAPMLATIEQINHAMSAFAPAYVKPAAKAMFRFYRDTRFSNDKRPYKDHIAAWWSPQVMDKTSGGGFYMHVSAKQVEIAAGVFMPQREQLLAIRTWMSEYHERYRKLEAQAIKPRKNDKLQLTRVDRPILTRMPKGFAADDPADELLRAKDWGVIAMLPAETALEPKFASLIANSFERLLPVVEALNESIFRPQDRERKVSSGAMLNRFF
ncbi:DUF2461 domain-containing protein [Granulicella cerasi]|uniref:DUF2461 domain-containing protein n=1 Tax=Granulicella cerasi TaxID=741063 RepID=A0ABW1Z905_9BACT|nr:DUF2461 domain-containing protein [Granulicella cerasi]